MRRVFFGLVALGAAVLVAVAASATGNLPGGTSIEAAVSSPADHALLPDAPFTAHGTAAVGQGQAVANTTLIYIVDVSGSTSAPTGGTSCPRQNVYDLQANTTLDCELLAVRDLNAAAITTGTVAKIGFIAFAGTNNDTPTNITSAAALDLDPTTGPATTLVAPNLSNFTPSPSQAATALFPLGDNLSWVTQSAYYAFSPISTPAGWPNKGGADGFTLFTADDVGQATNYYAALQTLRDLLTKVTTPRTQVVFLSDGLPNETVQGQQLSNILLQLHPANTAVTIDTFAVIGSGSTCGSPSPGTFGSLEQIANAFGKHCVGLSNPDSAVTSVPAAIASKLTVATLKVDGTAIPTTVGPTVVPTLPRTGPVNVTLTSSSPLSLAVGDHTICADANGQDGGGPGLTPVEECHTITIKAKPAVTITGDGPGGTVGATYEGTAFPLTATVDGATSTAWTSTGGTGSCSFGDPSQASTSVTCTDDGIYALTLTATDQLGQVTTATEHLLVNNVAPTAVLTLPPGVHPLANTITASVAISDPGADTFTCVLDWGEGAPIAGTVTGNTCTGDHIYAAGGSYTVSATVTDDDGGAGSDSQPIVIDAPPTAEVQPASGTEGTAFPLVAVVTDDHSTPIVQWSISGGTGTCSIADIHAASTTATCTDDGPYTATILYSDQVNGVFSATGTLNVANVPPTVTGVPLAGRVALNAPVTATYRFTDPGSNDTHTCSIDWGDTTSSAGVVDEAAHTCVGTHSYASAGSFSAVGTVSDDDHGSGAGTVVVTVDAPPTVTIGTGAGGLAFTDEGTAFVLNAVANDDHLGALTLHWSAAPSGPAGTCVFGNAASANTTVTCNDNGTYTLTLTANDGINAPVSASLELHVANVAPTLSLTGSVSALTASVTGAVTDVGANDTQTCTFDWGDGNSTPGVAVAGGVCQSSHPYASGTHTATITVTATDDDGGTTQRTITLTLNRPPSCTAVTPSLTELWPPNHTLQLIVLGHATDPDGDPLAYAITSVRQDEPTNGLGDGDTAIDAVNAGPGAVRLRAERAGGGDGRVYTIVFTVSDGKGGSCGGSVQVTVPKSASKPAVLTPGPGYDSYH